MGHRKNYWQLTLLEWDREAEVESTLGEGTEAFNGRQKALPLSPNGRKPMTYKAAAQPVWHSGQPILAVGVCKTEDKGEFLKFVKEHSLWGNQNLHLLNSHKMWDMCYFHVIIF